MFARPGGAGHHERAAGNAFHATCTLKYICTVSISTPADLSLMSTIPHYEHHADQLVSQYESLACEDVHAALLDLLPAAGATILDIGAGSGRFIRSTCAWGPGSTATRGT